MNYIDRIAEHCLKQPLHPAVEEADRTISYGDLNTLVIRATANLEKAGIKQGDIVAVLLPDSAEHLAIFIALARLGAISFSIYDSAMLPEQGDEAGEIAAIIAPSGTEAVPGYSLLDVADVFSPSVAGESWRPSVPGEFDGSLPLLLVQSSGTTGTPKRLMLTHGQMIARHTRELKYYGSQPGRYLSLIEMGLASGRQTCLNALRRGGTVVVLPGKSIVEVLTQLVERNITGTVLTTNALRAANQLARETGPAIPNIRLTTGGSKLASEDRNRARRLLTPLLFEDYGSHEVGSVAIANAADQERYPDSVGRLIDEIDAEIVDEEGNVLPPGAVGSLRLRGDDFPSAYYNNPEATARYFRGSWFYPGDLASVNADGYLFLKGRSDDVINFNGLKFYPIEIEEVLLEHEGVAEAAVVGRNFNQSTQVAVAFVAGTPNLNPDDLARHCLKRLPEYKSPKHVEIVNGLPRNPQGKILKTKLKEDFEARHGLTRSEAMWAGDAI